MNSRAKGQRGERAFAALLREHGYNAWRGRQYQGSDDSPDVRCDSLPDWHFEVKYTERLSLYDAMSQAKADAGDKIPTVAHRRNHGEWLIVLRAEDFFALVREYAAPGEAPSAERPQSQIAPRPASGPPTLRSTSRPTSR